MLRQVLHVDLAEISQARMQRKEREPAILDLQTLHQLAAKVQPRGGSHHGTFLRRENILIALLVLRLYRTVDILRERSLAQRVQSFLELIMIPVIKEAKRTSTRCRVVDYLGHHGIVLAKIQLIADTDLTSRIHQHVPQTQILVQLAQQEHLDTRAGLFLVAIQTSGKYFRVVEDKHVAFPIIV